MISHDTATGRAFHGEESPGVSMRGGPGGHGTTPHQCHCPHDITNEPDPNQISDVDETIAAFEEREEKEKEKAAAAATGSGPALASGKAKKRQKR